MTVRAWGNTRTSRPHDSTGRVEPATLYAGTTNYVATTDLQRSAGGRLGYSSQVQCSLVPSPTPSFSLFAVRTSLAVEQATKSWAWDWERGYRTTNLKLQLQTVNDERQSMATLQAPPPASAIIGLLAAPRRPGFPAYTITQRRVIPNHFSKSLQVTPSELDETWFVSSICGFMKPDKILLSYVVWLPDYSPAKMELFHDFYCRGNYSNPHNFPIPDCFVIPIAPS